MFSSKSFIVSDLTFRSLIYFEFTFVYDVRECSNFILLHVAVQFSQHHLLKRLNSYVQKNESIPYTKINSKWIKDKNEAIKFSGENIEIGRAHV